MSRSLSMDDLSGAGPRNGEPNDAGLSIALDDVARAAFEQLSRRSDAATPERLAIDPETVERDLPKLVLTLIEFIRQLLEAQAVRRMEAGRLTPEEEERLGMTLMLAREKLLEVAAEFGVAEEELTLDLGPLGRLV